MEQVNSKIMNYNKQVAFPDVMTRMLAFAIDFPIAGFVVLPLMQYSGLLAFQYLFHDFLAGHNIVLSSPNEIPLVVTLDDFQDQMTLNKGLFLLFSGLLAQYFLISLYFIISWSLFGTTLGKFLLKMKIVNFKTFKKPSVFRFILRYLCYIFAPINLFYIFFYKEKRAIHDYVAETIVIKS